MTRHIEQQLNTEAVTDLVDKRLANHQTVSAALDIASAVELIMNKVQSAQVTE